MQAKRARDHAEPMVSDRDYCHSSRSKRQPVDWRSAAHSETEGARDKWDRSNKKQAVPTHQSYRRKESDHSLDSWSLGDDTISDDSISDDYVSVDSVSSGSVSSGSVSDSISRT